MTELSAEEIERRESILRREFEGTSLPNELLSRTLAQLRDMPSRSLLEPIGTKFSCLEKQRIYDLMATSPFLREQSEIIRAWTQLRLQDILERGHIPSHVELFYIHEILGENLSAALLTKTLEALEGLDPKIRKSLMCPQNDLEKIIFDNFGQPRQTEKLKE